MSPLHIYPLKTREIVFSDPAVDEQDVQAVSKVIRSHWLTTGPQTRKFELEFAHQVDAEYAVAVNSCTAALHLALSALNIGPGEEVITTPYTFAATGEVIVHCGAKPVFVDIVPDGFNIDPDRIREAITPRTRAIIPVHFAGEPCDMEAIQDIADEHQLALIEDAAHALGAHYLDHKIGSISDATAFSFYATKNLTTGEGGMLTTNNRHLADQIRQQSLHGLSRDAWKRYSHAGSWYYEIKDAGFKYNMSDIQAAIGLSQLKKFDTLQEKRRSLVQLYYELLSDLDELELPPNPHHLLHAWHLFVIRLQTAHTSQDRDLLIQYLQKRGVQTSVHFIPLHLHPFYQQKMGYRRGLFPNTERTYEAAISLPLYPSLSEDDIEYITRSITEGLGAITKKYKTIPGGSLEKTI